MGNASEHSLYLNRNVISSTESYDQDRQRGVLGSILKESKECNCIFTLKYLNSSSDFKGEYRLQHFLKHFCVM